MYFYSAFDLTWSAFVQMKNLFYSLGDNVRSMQNVDRQRSKSYIHQTGRFSTFYYN